MSPPAPAPENLVTLGYPPGRVDAIGGLLQEAA